MGLVGRENYRFFHFSALAAIIAFGMLEMTAVSIAADNKESKEKQKTYLFIQRGKPIFTIPIPVEFRLDRINQSIVDTYEVEVVGVLKRDLPSTEEAL